MSISENLESTLTAIDLGPRHAALIGLCRVTAKQMDESDGAPSNRLSAVYLSCLKDLERAASSTPVKTHSSKLAAMRAARVRQAPTMKRASALSA